VDEALQNLKDEVKDRDILGKIGDQMRRGDDAMRLKNGGQGRS
jgi:hypothetical protein